MNIMKPSLVKATEVLITLFLVLAVFAASGFAADAYPSKPLRLIVAFPPGGTTDAQGRLIASLLAKRLGQPVVVENRGGGGSVIGTEMVAKADPDGYTLLIVDSSFTTQPIIQKLPYDPIKSFERIALLTNTVSVLAVNPSVPANSLKEFIALAKQKPGKLVFGTPGMGSSGHFAIEYFQMAANIDLKIVHFKGGGPLLIDALGGHSHGFLSSFATSLPYIDSGKLKALGTSGAKRSVIRPNVPTIAEAGDLPGFEYNGYRGIFAPAGTPAPIVDRLNKEIKAILTSEEVKKQLLLQGSEADYQGPTEYTHLIVQEMARWASVAKKANIRMEN